MEQLVQFKRWFDPLFAEYVRRKTVDFPQLPLFADLSACLRALAQGGKRIRPFIAFLAGTEDIDTLSDHSSILQLLFAIELYHLFALIHDDIIDQADTRHGIPCAHVQQGTGQAILMGDLCLSWAHECIAGLNTAQANNRYVSIIFSALAEETITGQMLDSALAGTIPATAALLHRSIELKTARYTFIYPIFLGRAFVDDAKQEEIEPLVRFGRALGHAFQRLDDLADIFWDEAMLGKSPGIDFRNGVPSHCSLFVQEQGTPAERSMFSLLFGNADATISSIRTLLVVSGAYACEKKAIGTLIADARAALCSITDSERWEACVAMLESKLNTL